jgi:energy-coupling factor transporter ATP-binding protein EcfA2
MRIRTIRIERFGPFRDYEVQFSEEENICLLLTGKNNEGKSTILHCLRLLSNATRVIWKKKQEISINQEIAYKLLVQDTEGLNIKRMVHNYGDARSKITGTFLDGFKLVVYVDPENEMIYADCSGRIPRDVENIFGFIPPLGPLSEREEVISRKDYLTASLNTSLAPRHLRNHLYQLISDEEFRLVREIFNHSWPDVKLLSFDVDRSQNTINCWYQEGRIERELCWAGQGLQVWIQIITHLVRLRSRSILVLDEPEINLHPEKQNDLIRILREYFGGDIIVATHSVELMNNVHISHILNVKKSQQRPKLKTTNDRAYLEIVRSEIGSDFNLVASQFEDVELIIFTENTGDFKIIAGLAKAYSVSRPVYNIPLYGFSEFRKAIAYKKAYELLIGKPVEYCVLLDRDYYPLDYLKEVKEVLEKESIRVVFTIGKEIENLFIKPNLLEQLCPPQKQELFKKFLTRMFAALYKECEANFITLHDKFLPGRIDLKTKIERFTPGFDASWKHAQKKFDMVAGKLALKRVRDFFRDECGISLSDQILIARLSDKPATELKKFLTEIYFG